MADQWRIAYEDGTSRTLTDDEAREVMRDLFGDDEDDTPRPVSDGGYNTLSRIEQA